MSKVAGRAVLAVAFVLPAALGAQGWAYPSFQPPRVMNREFNFGVADAGDAGTSLIFQWREGLSTRSQLGLDVGFADPEGKGRGLAFEHDNDHYPTVPCGEGRFRSELTILILRIFLLELYRSSG